MSTPISTLRLGKATVARENKLLIINLLAQIGFGFLCMMICLPSMQEWGQSFGASQASVQMTLSCYLASYASFQLVYGPLSDRHGRKAMLLAGLVLSFVGSLACTLATDLPALMGARFVQGAGGAAGMVVGRAMVHDLFQGSERTLVMAYVGMAMGLTSPLATIVGGTLHVRFGWQTNFVLTAALALVLMLAAWRGIPVHTPQSHSGTHWLKEMWRAYLRLVREPGFLLYVAVMSMTAAAGYVYLGGAAIVLANYGVGPDGVGWYIMYMPASYIVGSCVFTHLIHRQGARSMMAWGQASTLLGVGIMLGLAWIGIRTPVAFALPMVFMGIGHSFFTPIALAGTVGAAPGLAGAAAAIAGSFQLLTGAVGGFTVGLVSLDGPIDLGLLMWGFTLCAVLAQMLLQGRRMRARAICGGSKG